MKSAEISRSLNLIKEFDKLPVAASELGLAQQVQALQHSIDRRRPNRHLYNLLAMYMSRIEQHLQVCPFLPPPMPLNHGEIHIGEAITTPVSISFVSGQCCCTHLLFCGPVNTGKTYAISRLAAQAAEFFFVLLIDSRNQFSQFPDIRTTFQFTSIRDLRLNPFDEIVGLEDHEQDQVLVKGLKRSYDWQHAEREVNEAIHELRANDSLHMYGLLNHLRNKRYPPGTNRGRYRDTAVLSLSFLLDGTFPLFSCTRGMDIATLLSTTPLVLEINSVIEHHQNYIIRMIFDLVYLLGRAGKALDKPILIIIDEAQDLCERDIGQQLRTLRHSGIHLCLCVQNP